MRCVLKAGTQGLEDCDNPPIIMYAVSILYYESAHKLLATKTKNK